MVAILMCIMYFQTYYVLCSFLYVCSGCLTCYAYFDCATTLDLPYQKSCYDFSSYSYKPSPLNQTFSFLFNTLNFEDKILIRKGEYNTPIKTIILLKDSLWLIFYKT